MFARYQVAKSVLLAYFDAFKSVQDAPRTIFARHGLGTTLPNGEFEIMDNAPLDKVLSVLNDLCTIAGPQKAFEMGMNVVSRAAIPPGAKDIASAMQIFDSGYHLNHFCNGIPLFNTETGEITEGIGHYRCTYVSRHRLIMEVDVPYNCDVDRGIMQTWARKFDPTALLIHLEPNVCRKNRSPRCRYELSWK